MVYICKFINKNKLNEKLYLNNNDFIQQYLLLIDLWPSITTKTTSTSESTSSTQPILSVNSTSNSKIIEFFNQIVEGNIIEYLIWLYIEYEESKIASTNLSTSSNTHKTMLNFNCKTFSFNLLYKFCKENDTCRAEFGRINGIKKLIDQINSSNVVDNEKLIELLCFLCREAVNRHRFKEQNILNELLNLLKLNFYSKKNSNLTQKLINSICLFAHDQQSLNFFLENSICDCFIDYLNDNLKINDTKIQSDLFKSDYFNMKYLKFKQCQHENDECCLNKTFNLNEILAATSLASFSTRNKRKLKDNITITRATNSTIPQSISSPILPINTNKRVKHQTSYSPNVFLSPQPPSTSPPMMYSPHESAQESITSISPTYSRYSPSIDTNFSLSPSSSPPILLGTTPSYSPAYSTHSTQSIQRSSSAIMFDLESESEQTPSRSMQFSPLITNDTLTNMQLNAEDNTSDNVKNADNNNLLNLSFDNILPASPSNKKLARTLSSSSSISSQSIHIEHINLTEARIFYIFTMLSHSQTPSSYLLNDKFFTFLLNYLKLSNHNKNPRALRILNRLTKNPQCFQYFTLSQFSYKIKFIFHINDLNGENNDESDLDDDEDDEITMNQTSSSSLNNFKTINNQRVSNTIKSKTSTNTNEMQLYLDSNKVFFDSNIFPKLSSIEKLINQNLKQHCITSSDVCYQNLLNMVKYGTLKEKQSCSLEMPFVLRNCKAIENLMLQLNCLDILLDFICIDFTENITDDSNVNELFYKGLLCVRKLVKFVNYKQNNKIIRDNYEEYKLKLDIIQENSLKLLDEMKESNEVNNEIVEFLVDGTHTITVNKKILTKNSEYFNMLFNGEFYEAKSNLKQIELENVEYDCAKILFRLLNCNQDSNEQQRLTLKSCLKLIEICDQFMLFDIKMYISLFVSLNYLSKCTFLDCYLVALRYNCNYLLQTCLEYLFSVNYSQHKSQINKFIEYTQLFKQILQLTLQYSNLSEFKSLLKSSLTSVIKHNCWSY